MTELPIDTLIIIGLVIASFVGKFFQKKEGEKPKRTVGRTPLVILLPQLRMLCGKLGKRQPNLRKLVMLTKAAHPLFPLSLLKSSWLCPP